MAGLATVVAFLFRCMVAGLVVSELVVLALAFALVGLTGVADMANLVEVPLDDIDVGLLPS